MVFTQIISVSVANTPVAHYVTEHPFNLYGKRFVRAGSERRSPLSARLISHLGSLQLP